MLLPKIVRDFALLPPCPDLFLLIGRIISTTLRPFSFPSWSIWCDPKNLVLFKRIMSISPALEQYHMFDYKCYGWAFAVALRSESSISPIEVGVTSDFRGIPFLIELVDGPSAPCGIFVVYIQV